MLMRFDAVDTTDPEACAAFLDLALSLPEVQRWKQFSHDLLQIGHGDHVLDVGCGTGADAMSLARRVEPGGRVVGVDLSQALVTVAKSRAEGLGLSAAFEVADIHDLPFGDESFDRTRVDRVLHFLPDPGRALREVARVTAQGGRVVVTEPDLRTLTVSGGDPALTAAILGARHDSAPRNPIGSLLPQLFADAGLPTADRHESALELSDYQTATILFGLQEIAAHAAAVTVVSQEDAAGWLRSLQQASALGAFRCRLAGVIVVGTKPVRTTCLP